MVVLNPFLSLNSSSDKCLAWIKERLATANLRVVQTFDLSTARQALGECPCPHHGTEQCDCQMVVLLIYASGAEPATLILHGNDGQSWLSLVERPGQHPGEKMVRAIQKALEIKKFTDA